MSIESEARAEAEKQYSTHGEVPLSAGAIRNARREAFEKGYVAGASRPVSGEQVLAALNAENPRAATDDLSDWGDFSINRMRAALEAAREAGA